MRQPAPLTLRRMIDALTARVDALARTIPNPPVFAVYKTTGLAQTNSVAYDQLWVAVPYRRGARIGCTLYVDVSGGTGQLRLRMSSPVALNSAAAVLTAGAGQVVHLTLDCPAGWGTNTEAVIFVDGLVSNGANTLTARMVAAWQR